MIIKRVYKELGIPNVGLYFVSMINSIINLSSAISDEK